MVEESKEGPRCLQRAADGCATSACRDGVGLPEAAETDGLISCHSSPRAPTPKEPTCHDKKGGLRQTYRADALVSACLTAFDVGLYPFAQLFQQKCSLQSHFHDCAVEAQSSDPCLLVFGFDLI